MKLKDYIKKIKNAHQEQRMLAEIDLIRGVNRSQIKKSIGELLLLLKDN